MDLSFLTPALERIKALEERLAQLEQSENQSYIPTNGNVTVVAGGTVNSGLGTLSYSYHLPTTTSGVIPATARAVFLRLTAKWTVANENAYMMAGRSTSDYSVATRAIVGGVFLDQHGIVELTAGTLYLGAMNTYPIASSVYCVIRGYFN
jgi:hypothetical protein